MEERNSRYREVKKESRLDIAHPIHVYPLTRSGSEHSKRGNFAWKGDNLDSRILLLSRFSRDRGIDGSI